MGLVQQRDGRNDSRFHACRLSGCSVPFPLLKDSSIRYTPRLGGWSTRYVLNVLIGVGRMRSDMCLDIVSYGDLVTYNRHRVFEMTK
ncbi:hypothetical protein BRADI_5g20753v3 [Brachypodium distachyon]|uniref:Uncharacterized protein n=1 Tax=Brachypodium distachyon TaxID=15368 RepID=A0A2K2CID3_BRADI|nr:hypothetical protein BRADI_5g20753v3 [Brachypodium distachyon]